MDRLVAMRTFARVAELGSFSRAAESLQVPNAAVSTRIARLEAHLGVRLIARTTRRLRLTEDGAAYLETVQRLLAELDEAEAQLAGAVRAPRGRLRVDVPAVVARHVLAPALPDFLARYPEITVELGSTDRPVDLLQEGVDCVIRGGDAHDESLVARPLGAFELLTCATPGYLAAHGRPASPAELSSAHRGVAFFSAKTGRAFPFEFERDGERQVLSPSRLVCANDADTHLALTLAGLGIGQHPFNRVLAEHLEAGRLVPVLGEWSAGELVLRVMYLRDRRPSARVRVFVDWVVALYAEEFRRLAQRKPHADRAASPR